MSGIPSPDPAFVGHLRRIIVLSLALAIACEPRPGARTDLPGGNAERGREALRAYGCSSCHTIPGVRGARSQVGPPLGGIASRMYIAGVLPNAPANMVRWIQDPPGVDSLTAMPKLGVTERDARDIASYLYRLR